MIDHKEALRQHYTSFDGFYSHYFPQHKVLANGEWQVRCPFHDDGTPSMSVSPQTGLFKCHGCNAQGDFIKFYMMKTGKTFKEAVVSMCEEAGIKTVAPKQEKRRIEKTYDYLDANGEIVSQTVRFMPKSFSQRVPNGNGWDWSLKGIKTVIYNLPDVIKSNQVLILEGEKDCDTSKIYGYTATTCPMGAGKWRDDYSKYLYGKEVVLIPDNDGPGIKHMMDIGTKLRKYANVKWFQFPDNVKMHKGFDFTDFVNSFENEFECMKTLDELIRAARTFDPAKIIIPEPDTEESEKIKAWIMLSPGEFSIRDLDYDLNIKDPEQKIHRIKILEKFVAEKLLSREGKKRGYYRPYKSDLERMDFKFADDKFLDVWLPFKLHDLVGLLPGNIVIVAGEPNAGKTALLLNLIKANRKRFDVHYFNSEMGSGELKTRLSKFDDFPSSDWSFNAYHRDSDFEDVIFKGPKSLNIIDFLEVHDNFYLIGDKIKKIHEALDGGIAVIAVQRNKGAAFGLGGQRTMEKARLVINISPGIIQITKAKNFINPGINPNWMKVNFNLVNGCKFVMQGGGWYREEA
ncbi:CHC2 zinc finger domain-containing protein [Desulfobacula toluolica]|uniref:Predicted DNA-binding protein n=1 Tax=Desulfobacula toluolica (strain DSM 7467 / Tol2) TaxID=651182 RepID=K0NCV8_DESTT|nr:CHC2 zinc finger domain-containing protein [Desulfobacula toluolica]CCK82409.1 predicted DNA-binding protein [Desulfobacula toluolica Tol2]